jgi:rSAM/selenodomain-associated transferase 2
MIMTTLQSKIPKHNAKRRRQRDMLVGASHATVVARATSHARASTSAPAAAAAAAARARGVPAPKSSARVVAASSASSALTSTGAGDGDGGDDGRNNNNNNNNTNNRWWRDGDFDDGFDDDGVDDARAFHQWVKFLVCALAARWLVLRAMAMNDAPVYAKGDDWNAKRVSIVIPARNEAKAIGAVLRRVTEALEPSACDVVVAVGDSTDDTAAIAKKYGATVVSGAKGRGNQMNAGARVAKGDYLLFLHADTTPPADVVDVIRRQLRDEKTVIGGFVSLIETPTKTYWAMSYHNVIKTTYCAVVSRPFAYLRGFRILFGDQAMFCRAEDFAAVGGFDGSIPIMEDADLCVRMHYKGTRKFSRGRIKLLDRVVTTSGRRIEQLGNFRATCVHVLIACSWNFGVGERNLRRLYDWCYRDVR